MMKNHILLLAFVLFAMLPGFSQGPELMVRHQDSRMYLEHAVSAKEGLYSIGRLYNVHPKHLAAFNKVDLNAGLTIGQVIQVPLTDTNFNQKSTKGVPIYYTVGEGEGLMKVSNAHRKLSLASIRQWNKLTSDVLRPGNKLIVGYLNSPESANLANRAPVVTPEKQVAQAAPPVTQTPAPVSNEPAPPTVKEADKPVATNKPVVTPRQEPAPAPVSAAGDEGFFKADFLQQVKATPASRQNTVTGGIFKTISGWQDAKFYLLIDDVPTGSIVRITNPDNNRIVYAKVLGEMNGIRQNQGLGIRISSAAASALGITETEKFIVKINY